MDSGVGPVLRKARARAKIELSEVEAATRIRAKFLRAIEAEEWDVLPGGVYTRGFIRTYATFLGLDGERLAEDYRREVEGWRGGHEPDAELGPLPRSSGGSSRRERHPYRLRWLAVPAVLLVALFAIVVLSDGGEDGQGANQAGSSPGSPTGDRNSNRPEPAPRPAGHMVRLTTSAEVWVCLLDAAGNPLVDGQILEAGAQEGPFRSGSFTVSFGNGEVSMLIDGKQAEIPATSSPVGYSIDSTGELTELDEAERPTCT